MIPFNNVIYSKNIQITCHPQIQKVVELFHISCYNIPTLSEADQIGKITGDNEQNKKKLEWKKV